jgi:hypothetical protein
MVSPQCFGRTLFANHATNTMLTPIAPILTAVTARATVRTVRITARPPPVWEVGRTVRPGFERTGLLPTVQRVPSSRVERLR